MSEVTATEASRRFADLLDGVEHRGEEYTIIRRGRVIARLTSAPAANGALVRELIKRHQPDPDYAADIAAARELLVDDAPR